MGLLDRMTAIHIPCLGFAVLRHQFWRRNTILPIRNAFARGFKAPPRVGWGNDPRKKDPLQTNAQSTLGKDPCFGGVRDACRLNDRGPSPTLVGSLQPASTDAPNPADPLPPGSASSFRDRRMWSPRWIDQEFHLDEQPKVRSEIAARRS